MRIGAVECGESRSGTGYASLRSFRGEVLGEINISGSDVVRWNLRRSIRKSYNLYSRLTIDEVLDIFDRAGRIFAEDELPMGDAMIGVHEYANLFCASTGGVISAPLATVKRIREYFSSMRELLAFQAMDGDINAYSRGYVERGSRAIGWVPVGQNCFIMCPSNHSSVNILWTIACAMGYPLALRPSLSDPFTPLRIIQALIKAGLPPEAVSYYPSDHAAVGEMVQACDLSILFGGSALERAYGGRRSVKVFGPGRSAIIVGKDYANRIDEVVDLAVTSMLRDGGRGCINASMLITAGDNAEEIARRIAEKIASIQPVDPTQIGSTIPAFPDRAVAAGISSQIDGLLRSDARDVTAEYRKSPRLVENNGATYLLPTVVLCQSGRAGDDNIFGREYGFPFLSVAQITDSGMLLDAVKHSLVVTLLSDDEELRRSLLFCPGIGKVYHGAYATCDISFLEPHEGFMSDFLYKTKALRIPVAAPHRESSENRSFVQAVLA